MKRGVLWIAAVLSAVSLVFAFAACGGDDDEAEIVQLVDAYQEAVDSGDAAAICSLQTPELSDDDNYSNGSCEESNEDLELEDVTVANIKLYGRFATADLSGSSEGEPFTEKHVFETVDGEWKLGVLYDATCGGESSHPDPPECFTEP